MSDMNTIKDGGPAFPLATDGGHFCEGMTLRDYMAIHASEADILNQGEVAARCRSHEIGVLPDGWRCTARYMHADTMIRARALLEKTT